MDKSAASFLFKHSVRSTIKCEHTQVVGWCIHEQQQMLSFITWMS